MTEPFRRRAMHRRVQGTGLRLVTSGRFCAFLVACAAAVLLWMLPNLPSLPVDAGVDKIDSISFSPYADGQDPTRKLYPAPEQIAEDLRRVAEVSRGVRTYAASEGLEQVPVLAGTHGLRVWQGVWLDDDRQTNEHEILAGIQLARDHPGTIELLVVGSEVLLRGNLAPEELATDLTRVRESVSQPVGYADVWEFWLRHPELAESVDVIIVHLLPYWEDEPIPIDRAVDHAMAAYAKVRDAFPDKPVLVGEAGWPAAGRMREGAAPGLVNQARFVREFIVAARSRGIEYNLFEAFNQEWKYAFEGTVGANWGFFDRNRVRKFPLNGPVVEDRQWPIKAASTAIIALGLAVAGLRSGFEFWRCLAISLLAVLLAGMVVLSAFDAVQRSYTWQSALIKYSLASAQFLLALLLLGLTARRLGGGAPVHRGVEPAVIAVVFVFLILALWHTVALIDTPRYREFPVPHFLVPSLGLPLCVLASRLAGQSLLRMEDAWSVHWRKPRLFGSLLVILTTSSGAVLLLVNEGLANHQALVWSLMVVLLATPQFIFVARAIGRHCRTLS